MYINVKVDLNIIFSVELKRILKFMGKINYMIDVGIFLCNLRIWGILYLVDKYIYKDDVYICILSLYLKLVNLI